MAGPAPSKKRDPAHELMAFGTYLPEYQQMMNYLMARRAVPPININRSLEDNGVFEYPGVSITSPEPAGNNGRISIYSPAGVNTLVHEVTHASQMNLARQYTEEKYPNGLVSFTTGRTPFTTAYEKLRLHNGGPGGKDPLEVLAPKWKQAEADYRSTFQEAQAFGVANSAMPEQANNPGPRHVDATLATEFLILLDLATRSQAKKPQSQGR